MVIAKPYLVTSIGNQFCLMIGCHFSKRLECFPIPDQKATTIAGKLVYEIVARYGVFRELVTNRGQTFGLRWWPRCADSSLSIRRGPPRSDRFSERSFRTLGC